MSNPSIPVQPPAPPADGDTKSAGELEAKLKHLYANATSASEIFPDIPAGAPLWERILETWGALRIMQWCRGP
jgi:hypothetical protein